MIKQKTFKHFIMSAVLLLCVLITLGRTGLTVEASSGAVVRKVSSVNKLTGSRTIKLAKGKKAYLKTTVTVKPNRSENKKVTYKSSNKKVATVTSRGVITGKKPGKAKITITSVKDRKRKATVNVTVVKGRVTNIAFNKNVSDFFCQIKKGDTIKLKPVITTSAGGSKAVVWTTSNKKVAKVDKKGMVTAVGKGNAWITVTAADGTGTAASFFLTVDNYKLKYKYEVMFLHPPYSDIKSMVYIKTNNPSDDNFWVSLYNTDGENQAKTVYGTSYEYADLKDLGKKSVNSYYKVKDGYIREIGIENSGKFKVRIEEFTRGTYRSYLTGYDNAGYIGVKDYAKEKKEWMQSVIDGATISSMTKKEKMEAITRYMDEHSVYLKTPSNNVGYSLSLAAEVGVPFWKIYPYEFDSYTSPLMLAEFGSMIDYPLKSLYWEYEYGTPEWYIWHYVAESVKDGSYYAFCHTGDSNIVDVSKIKQINLSKWNFYKCYK